MAAETRPEREMQSFLGHALLSDWNRADRVSAARREAGSSFLGAIRRF